MGSHLIIVYPEVIAKWLNHLLVLFPGEDYKAIYCSCSFKMCPELSAVGLTVKVKGDSCHSILDKVDRTTREQFLTITGPLGIQHL